MKRRVAEEPKPLQNVDAKKEHQENSVHAKSFLFYKFDEGKIVGRRNFKCFVEDELEMLVNINHFLQKAENDDDVETEETLDYYINKVRAQLEEAVEAQRELRKKSRIRT